MLGVLFPSVNIKFLALQPVSVVLVLLVVEWGVELEEFLITTKSMLLASALDRLSESYVLVDFIDLVFFLFLRLVHSDQDVAFEAVVALHALKEPLITFR